MYYSSNPSECFKPIAGLFYLIAQGFRSSVSTFFYALRSKCTDSGLLTVVHMVRQPCSSPHMLDSTRAYIWWQVRMVTSSTLRCLLLPRYFCWFIQYLLNLFIISCNSNYQGPLQGQKAKSAMKLWKEVEIIFSELHRFFERPLIVSIGVTSECLLPL